jgi:hypothetical protein
MAHITSDRNKILVSRVNCRPTGRFFAILSASDAKVEQLRDSFVRSPRKLKRRASRENGSHFEPQLSQIKLVVYCYIMTVQSTVYIL